MLKLTNKITISVNFYISECLHFFILLIVRIDERYMHVDIVSLAYLNFYPRKLSNFFLF